MPTYNFRHIHTGEIIEKIMRISEKANWLEANPEYESVILEAPLAMDSVRLNGFSGKANGFKEVLRNIKERTPGSNLDV